MNVALAYNVKKNKPSTDLKEQVDLEFDSVSVIEGIGDALKSLGHTVFLVEADENTFLKLKELKGQIDIVFNIAEGLWGDARESQVPLFCEVLKIPYTHSGPTTHAIKLDKEFTKYVLKGAGIANVPGDSNFPLIVKPNREGSSKGIMDKNVVRNKEELDKQIKELSKTFDGDILVEEYIEGREFTVAVLGNKDPQVLPIVEQKFDFLPKGMNKIASFELKWIYEDTLKNLSDAYDCPAKLDKKLEDEIVNTSKEIYRLLDVRDCARIDYRLDKEGKLYFLEINTLPGLNMDETVISYLPLAARVAGMSSKDLIGKILDLACERYGLNSGRGERN
jgi:D-alanine-D-alanine ligase